MRAIRIVPALVLTVALCAPGHAQTTTSRGVEVLRPTAPPAPPAPVAQRACSRPYAATDLTFRVETAPAKFSAALRSRLQAKAARVTIDIAQPFPLGSPGPQPLASWLTEARAKGGLVSVAQYCEAPRGLFSWLRKVFSGDAQTGYDAVDGYDAVLHADGANGVVTQVEFRRRSGA